MIVAASLVLLAAGASGGTSSVAPAHTFWIQPQPADPDEAEIVRALGIDPFQGPLAKVEALKQLAARRAGTPAAGLARIAAGFLLLEADQAPEAAAMLRDADVGRSPIADRGQIALAEALLEARDPAAAGAAFLAAFEMRPDGAAACEALRSASEAFSQAKLRAKAVSAAEKAAATCTSGRDDTLLALGRAQEANGNLRAAASSYDALDRDYPTSAAAREAAPRLRALSRYLPSASTAQKRARAFSRAEALLDARRNREAIRVLRSIGSRGLDPEQADLLRVRLGRAYASSNRTRDARSVLTAVKAGSPYEAEAAFWLARAAAHRAGSAAPYEDVVSRFPGTRWAEDALLALANDHQKDARDEEALPYYRRLLESFPDGRYVERATWRVGWGDFRAGRYEEAARVMERAARQRPQASATPAFLYWTARARLARGRIQEARPLLEETVQRFKRSYHGMLAQRTLASLPALPSPPAASLQVPSLVAAGPPAIDVAEPAFSRVRLLLLIERYDEACEELAALPRSATQQATLAWAEWRRGRLRPAINALRRAYPEWVGAAGDRLPQEAWRILYPLEYETSLREQALQEGLDPALVAALVLQESTFDAGAVSAAGARGLMQIMPATGRTLARSAGMRYRRSILHQPSTSLDFGTRYLKGLLDRFGGRVEQALAAYNAGPHRVDAWTQGRPEMSAEEFVESIPFTETRYYVMNILAAREQYRELYGLPAGPGAREHLAPEGSPR